MIFLFIINGNLDALILDNAHMAGLLPSYPYDVFLVAYPYRLEIMKLISSSTKSFLNKHHFTLSTVSCLFSFYSFYLFYYGKFPFVCSWKVSSSSSFVLICTHTCIHHSAICMVIFLMPLFVARFSFYKYMRRCQPFFFLLQLDGYRKFLFPYYLEDLSHSILGSPSILLGSLKDMECSIHFSVYVLKAWEIWVFLSVLGISLYFFISANLWGDNENYGKITQHIVQPIFSPKTQKYWNWRVFVSVLP